SSRTSGPTPRGRPIRRFGPAGRRRRRALEPGAASAVAASSSKKSNWVSSSTSIPPLHGRRPARTDLLPAQPKPGSLPPSAAAPPQELSLGRYRPGRPLGSGGMGHVWLARDEGNGLDVALKMVGREGKSAARAEREAKAAAALRHPHCQRIYALARDPGHVY